MVTLLRRLFIRDYADVENQSVRVAHGRLSALLGLILNSILVGLKLSSAILLAKENAWVFSMALLGDAMNNFFDFAGNLATLFGFHASSKPADEDHPYGHQRAEYLATLFIGIVIAASAILLLYHSIDGLVAGRQVDYDTLTLIALGATLPIKGIQCYVNFGLGKAIHSSTLKSVAIDALLDIIVSTTLFTVALISRFVPMGSADGWLGIFLAAVLGYGAFKVLREATSELLGARMDPKFYEKARALALEEEGVLGVHDLICHSYGEASRYLYLHAEVDASLSLMEAHGIADALERKLSNALHCPVSIHVDPVDADDAELSALKAKVHAILAKYPYTHAHDIHFHEEDGRRVLAIEVAVPYGFDEGKQEEMKKELSSLYGDVEATFEHPYGD